MTTTRKAKARFSMEVGRLVAGQVERELRRSAHQADVSIEIEKHMGLLDGVLLVRAEGDADRVVRWTKAVQAWEPF